MKGAMDKFLGLMRLNDDDYEEEYDDEYEEIDEEEEKVEKSTNIFPKKTKKEEKEEPVISETPKRQNYRRTANNKVVSMNGYGVEVFVIKPQDFSESKVAADLLREGRTVVINMEGVVNPEAQRTIDFIGGACYAVDGTLQAISKNIFIAAPDNIEVNGDLRDEIMNEDIVSPKISE